MAGANTSVKLYPSIDKPEVRIFIDSKARKSRETALAYKEGLYRMDNFLRQTHPGLDVVSVLKLLQEKQLDVYKLIDEYLSFLLTKNYATKSVLAWLSGPRSYFQYHDIDIIPAKLRHKVTIPQDRKEDEYALDKEEIRKILTRIRQPRLKTYCMVLACGGMRAVEALAIRIKDIDFNVQPTKIYMQAKYSKNKLPREIYITAEATDELKVWLDHKYPNGTTGKEDDLVFGVMDNATPNGMYNTISAQFRDALKAADLDDRKDGKQSRGKITLHSFRRFVYTTIEGQAGQPYAEYILGHKKTVYHTKKEHERRAIYAECERYLRFTDYSGIDKQNKTLEGQITEEKERLKKQEERLTRLEERLVDADINNYVKQLELFQTLAPQFKTADKETKDKLIEMRGKIENDFFAGVIRANRRAAGEDDTNVTAEEITRERDHFLHDYLRELKSKKMKA